MESYIKKDFCAALFSAAKDIDKRDKPDALPPTLVSLYDEVCELSNRLCRSGHSIDPRQYWVVAKLHELGERISALEKADTPIADDKVPPPPPPATPARRGRQPKNKNTELAEATV